MVVPHRAGVDIEEMHISAVGTGRPSRCEPMLSSFPAFMVSKAANAAVWEDLKDTRTQLNEGNPLNLYHFLESLDNRGMTISEDMDLA